MNQKPLTRSRPLLLAVEDEPAILDVLRIGLRDAGFDVVTAADGETGIAQFLERDPDLVILDILLPKVSGWEVCRRVRAQSKVPILMLTALDSVKDKLRGFELGVDDYLAKPFAFEELLARIRALLKRSGHSADPVLRFADVTLDDSARAADRGGSLLPLTPKEFDLLRLFLRHPNIVMSRSTILQDVWGNDYEGDSNVVEVFVGQLRKKLGDPPLIHTSRGVGYVLKSGQ